MSWFRRLVSHIGRDKKGDAYAASELSSSSLSRNSHLIWLDTIRAGNDDARVKFRNLPSTVETFTDVNECVNHVISLAEHHIVLILSGVPDHAIISMVHDMPQISAVYIHCQRNKRRASWASHWSKIRGVFTDLAALCQAIGEVAPSKLDENSFPLSVIAVAGADGDVNLDQLDPSFMYTQILKEILLTIEFDESHVQDFLTYYRTCVDDGDTEAIQEIEEFRTEYRPDKAVYWYTRDFLYEQVNKALREMDVTMLIKLGFFLRDLHIQLTSLQLEKPRRDPESDALSTLYRGQSLPRTKLDEIRNNQGGLLAFNCFLSTSESRDEAIRFAMQHHGNADKVNILYIISVNSVTSSTPFAEVTQLSFHDYEYEVLFSMHSIFRIGEVNWIDTSPRPLWEVHLTATNDTDERLRAVTNCIRRETFVIDNGWYRLGNLLHACGEYERAEEMCYTLFEQLSEPCEIASIHHLLGMIRYSQGYYHHAIKAYRTSIQIKEKILSPSDVRLASSYNNLGEAYNKTGDYSKAFPYLKKALELKKETHPANHPTLALSHDNMGAVLHNMGVYPQALLYYEKARDIREETLPALHPDLSQSYHNIGRVLYHLRRYSEAIPQFKKAIDIKERILPSKHTSLAASYHDLGAVHERIRQYQEAHSWYQKAFQVFSASLPENHADLKRFRRDVRRVENR